MNSTHTVAGVPKTFKWAQQGSTLNTWIMKCTCPGKCDENGL